MFIFYGNKTSTQFLNFTPTLICADDLQANILVISRVSDRQTAVRVRGSWGRLFLFKWQCFPYPSQTTAFPLSCPDGASDTTHTAVPFILLCESLSACFVLLWISFALYSVKSPYRCCGRRQSDPVVTSRYGASRACWA